MMPMNDRVIDLRSDTVTQPTPAMRAMITDVPVGDDGYGEDPTVNRLEEMSADLLGKESALLVASGTQANLVAMMALTVPGQEVILEADSHMVLNEAGGYARIAGLALQPLGGDYGVLTGEQIAQAIRPKSLMQPPTGLVAIENTHNRAGGTVWPLERIVEVTTVAREHGIPVHMDGARLFNASVALGVPVREVVRDVDVVTFCLSKGLCCPAGSIVAGPADVIHRARQARQVLGGRMRQAGWIAGPGIVALATMVNRLVEDHRLARSLGEQLARVKGLAVDLTTVQTNMVRLDVSGLGPKVGAVRFAALLAEAGIRANPSSPTVIRLVTHYGITPQDIDVTVSACLAIAEQLRLSPSRS